MPKWSSESTCEDIVVNMGPKRYREDELLRVRPSARISAEVVRRINQSGAGIRGEFERGE